MTEHTKLETVIKTFATKRGTLFDMDFIVGKANPVDRRSENLTGETLQRKVMA